MPIGEQISGRYPREIDDDGCADRFLPFAGRLFPAAHHCGCGNHMGCTSWPTTCNSERIRAFQQRAHLGKIVSGKEREARRYGVRDGLVPILRIRVGDLLEHATVDSGYAFSACGMGYEVCWKQPK